MTALVFKDPPVQAGGQRGTNLDHDIASALRRRPNEWALIGDYGNRVKVTGINRGTSPAYRPAGAFEATARTRADGRVDVYARFVGGQHAV